MSLRRIMLKPESVKLSRPIYLKLMKRKNFDCKVKKKKLLGQNYNAQP